LQRALVAKWYDLYGIAILTILAPSQDIFYCYDISRYIMTLAILVSSHRYRQ